MDEADYIDKQYFLEVSSPGIERVLKKDKHLKQNLGSEIEIKLFRPIDKKKSLEGTLEKFDEEKIYIKIDEDEKEINRKDIAQIKTKYRNKKRIFNRTNRSSINHSI